MCAKELDQSCLDSDSPYGGEKHLINITETEDNGVRARYKFGGLGSSTTVQFEVLQQLVLSAFSPPTHPPTRPQPHHPLPGRVRMVSYLIVPLPVGTGALGPPSALSAGVVAVHFGPPLGLALGIRSPGATSRHDLALTSPQSARSASHASTSPRGRWG